VTVIGIHAVTQLSVDKISVKLRDDRCLCNLLNLLNKHILAITFYKIQQVEIILCISDEFNEIKL
jgi:hypothetical protein